MRRLLVIAAIFGALGISAVAVIYKFGCCVLPFHRVLHKIAPLCSIATMISAGAPDDPAEPSQLPDRQEQSRRPAMALRTLKFATAPTTQSFSLAMISSVSPRSLITLGAVRCDEDVGLSVLNETFRI